MHIACAAWLLGFLLTRGARAERPPKKPLEVAPSTKRRRIDRVFDEGLPSNNSCLNTNTDELFADIDEVNDRFKEADFDRIDFSEMGYEFFPDSVPDVRELQQLPLEEVLRRVQHLSGQVPRLQHCLDAFASQSLGNDDIRNIHEYVERLARLHALILGKKHPEGKEAIEARLDLQALSAAQDPAQLARHLGRYIPILLDRQKEIEKSNGHGVPDVHEILGGHSLPDVEELRPLLPHDVLHRLPGQVQRLQKLLLVLASPELVVYEDLEHIRIYLEQLAGLHALISEKSKPDRKKTIEARLHHITSVLRQAQDPAHLAGRLKQCIGVLLPQEQALVRAQEKHQLRCRADGGLVQAAADGA